MTHSLSSDHEAIRDAVRAINENWQAKRYDRIGPLLAEEAVVAHPGFGSRTRGRTAYLQSYLDYDRAATTVEFVSDEPQVDVVGDTAVAVCPFRIVYDIKGTRHRERGHDILVFSRSRGEWKVVWRTMQTEPIAEQAG
jgi:ketosteroid isomerase-like protein